MTWIHNHLFSYLHGLLDIFIHLFEVVYSTNSLSFLPLFYTVSAPASSLYAHLCDGVEQKSVYEDVISLFVI